MRLASLAQWQWGAPFVAAGASQLCATIERIRAPASMAAASVPGLVLCIADGIVRIVVRVVAGEDLGGRARREVNPLIGVTAHKCERCDRSRDAEPSVRLIVGMAPIRLH
jgi:hypothetical protein